MASASHGRMRPAASGRARVRSTSASKLRSAKSFIAQPAERMTTVPSTKIHSTANGGLPKEAIHSAQSVGHSSSRMPMGLSRRTSFSYASRRARSVLMP